jgi:hypothetical protein
VGVRRNTVVHQIYSEYNIFTDFVEVKRKMYAIALVLSGKNNVQLRDQELATARNA